MSAIFTAIFLLSLLPLASPAPRVQASQSAAPATPAGQAGTFSTEQLEQLVAPIALHPDSLLTQILMASTYPLEVVSAARWVKQNPKVTGDTLEAALKDQTWDPSVKSLCGFPDVLERMNVNLDWTQDLGDAFLGQQAALMDAVQNMRRKAYDAKNLKSSKELTVTEQSDKIIVVVAANPEVIYVPTYYPSAVYGSWGYPYWYYPPLYVPPPPGAMLFVFTVGVAWGAGCWGGCHWGWGHTDIDINVNRYNTFVKNTEIDARRQSVQNKVGSSGGWQHNPEHRLGVGYKDGKVAQQYGATPGQARVSREQARGFSDRAAPRQGTKQAGENRPAAPARDVAKTRPDGGAPATSRPAPAPRPSTTPAAGARGGLSGSSAPTMDRAASQRGSMSRGSPGARGAHGGGRPKGR